MSETNWAAAVKGTRQVRVGSEVLPTGSVIGPNAGAYS